MGRGVVYALQCEDDGQATIRDRVDQLALKQDAQLDQVVIKF